MSLTENSSGSTAGCSRLVESLEVPTPPTYGSSEGEMLVHDRLASFVELMDMQADYCLGYPANLDFDFSRLSVFTRYHINNCGDPFETGNYKFHSKEFEREVLSWFAHLWALDTVDKEPWGYVTNGGTEGNMFATYIARELLPDGVVYASQRAHYSIPKAARMMRVDFESVLSHNNGPVDCDDLKKRLLKNKGRPAILMLSIGTTMTGAVDDLDDVLDTLASAGYGEGEFYIHCDAALSGLLLPFARPGFLAFNSKAIHSISVSGHKFVGSPVPCGVVMILKSLVDRARLSEVDYIGMRDSTLTGSRNGLAAVYLWYALARKGYAGMGKDVAECYRNANELKRMLEAAGIPNVSLADWSTTVVFQAPDETIRKTWNLACEGDLAHVVVMQHVTLEKLERFVHDIVSSQTQKTPKCQPALASATTIDAVEDSAPFHPPLQADGLRAVSCTSGELRRSSVSSRKSEIHLAAEAELVLTNMCN